VFSSYTRSTGTQNTHWIAFLIAGVFLPAATLSISPNTWLTQGACLGLSAVLFTMSFLFRRNSTHLTVPSLNGQRVSR
jgi:hypothetical protein